MEKYKELYNLSKEVLNEELSRFARIDDKTAKYLSILTLVAGVSGFFGKWLIDNLIPPKTTAEWALVILGAFLFIFRIIFLVFLVCIYYNIIHEKQKIKGTFKSRKAKDNPSTAVKREAN